MASMKPKLRALHISIEEKGDCWLAVGGGYWRAFDTAWEALCAIKSYASKLAKDGDSTVAIIAWTTSTRVGAQVVRAISQ